MFYDAETTGIPKYKLPSSDPSQPRIIEIAAELCIESTGETLARMDMLIRPEGWVIPKEVEDLTGITNEQVNAFGLYAQTAIGTFIQLWEMADTRCGHNESFDARMIRIELMRHVYLNMREVFDKTVGTAGAPIPFADHWKKAPAYCTKNSSASIVNLPPTAAMVAKGMTAPKSPTLGEAFKFFFGHAPEVSHRAGVDVTHTKEVYYAIKAHEAEEAA